MRSAAPRLVLRPLLLPTEHGGWGFLFEPLVLGLAVVPSIAGALVALGALLGFLARQPLKLAMQDALRGKRYQRTAWCRFFAATYAMAAVLSIAGAVALAGWNAVTPFVCVAPLAAVALLFDAKNRSREAVAEYAGSMAMSAIAASIALAGGAGFRLAIALSTLVVLRGLPSISFVRTLLKRAHGHVASAAPALALHAAAIPLAWAAAGSPLAASACAALLGRAVWTLVRPVPRAQTIGWREIAWGALTVAVFVAALR